MDSVQYLIPDVDFAELFEKGEHCNFQLLTAAAHL